MTFFSIDGKEVTGNIDEFGGGFDPMPHGTQARALIKKIELDEYNGDEFYKVHWKLMEGTFKNRVIFQKIHCFSPVETKRKRAISMLARLFNLCDVARPDVKPENSDLREIQDKILGIKIGLFVNEETQKEYNYIEMIFANDDKFIWNTPRKISRMDAALGVEKRNYGLDTPLNKASNPPAASGAHDFDDDIPF